MSTIVHLKRYKPYNILCFEALFRALKPQYRNNQVLLNDFSNEVAGFQGEKYTDYMVSIYPHKNAHLFRGLRLRLGPYHFQMDTLIVTSTFLLILETKNWKSEVEYDPSTHQTTQNDGSKKKGFKSPVLQANNQKLQLASWLQKHRFPPIPIETIAVLSNSSTILTYKGESNEIQNKFIHLDNLPSIFDQHYTNYTKPIVNQATITKLNHMLRKSHTPYKPDYLSKYGITNQYLVRGIVCNNCDHYPLIYSSRTWHCSNCGKKNKLAHEQKILDYFLLHKPTITNRECRELLQIDSPKVVYRLLNSMNLRYSGKNLGRKYLAPKLEEYPQELNFPMKRNIFQS
ncbi:nuclease-related domain-containing protein [Ornithinibacillus halotolerans]|uniref:NERD domain-containing protein n=1 Tax=Ornithinibacillus halotolerans TaxID=1274357 RepID=A0A916W3J3_9BACI|nr:nuclease-related domain-containing protein [Ornithinibacillus halotolerans]GGA64474.1 hypothetical protein GCM10008025_05430 [Ornithinibacillus halotolerans]